MVTRGPGDGTHDEPDKPNRIIPNGKAGSGRQTNEVGQRLRGSRAVAIIRSEEEKRRHDTETSRGYFEGTIAMMKLIHGMLHVGVFFCWLCLGLFLFLIFGCVVLIAMAVLNG